MKIVAITHIDHKYKLRTVLIKLGERKSLNVELVTVNYLNKVRFWSFFELIPNLNQSYCDFQIDFLYFHL